MVIAVAVVTNGQQPIFATNGDSLSIPFNEIVGNQCAHQLNRASRNLVTYSITIHRFVLADVKLF